MTRDELKKFLEQDEVIRAHAYVYDVMYRKMNRTSKNIINLDRYIDHLCEKIIHVYPIVLDDDFPKHDVLRLAFHETGMVVSQKSFELFEMMRNRE